MGPGGVGELRVGDVAAGCVTGGGSTSIRVGSWEDPTGWLVSVIDG